MKMKQETRYIEIARNNKNNSQILFDLIKKNVKIQNKNQQQKQITLNKIKDECFIASISTLPVLLTLHRQIRKKLGNPTSGSALYPKPKDNRREYHIRRSINLLLHYPKRFSRIQNAIIEGLESKIIKYLKPINKEVNLENSALLTIKI